jgi:LysR family transcriptional regulator, positive regulator for ilvC
MDDVRSFRLYLHLARTLNFGRTSLECHVSPATLTRTVQRFREYATRAVELWESYQAAGPPPADLAGELSVFATVTACQALLPSLLAPLRAAHPRIRLDLRTGDAAAALARLDEGEVDAAVAGLPARLPESLVAAPVATTPLVFVGKNMEGPFVLPRRGLVRDAADRWFRANGQVPEVAAEPEGHEALLTLAALGFGTGIVPKLVLDHSATRDLLTILPVIPPPAPHTIGLCVRRDSLRRPLVAALWSSLGPPIGPSMCLG